MTPALEQSGPSYASPLAQSLTRLAGFGGFRKQIALGAGWTALGAAVAQLSSLITGVLVARELGREAYGKFGLLQTTIAMWSLFTGLGLSFTATRYLSRYRLERPADAGRVIGATHTMSLAAAGILCLAFYLVAGAVSHSLSHRDDLTGLLRICTFTLFAASLLAVQQGILTGFESFRAASSTNISRGILLIPLVILGIHVRGLAGALWAMGIATAVGGLVAARLIRLECRNHGIQAAWQMSWTDMIMVRDCALPTFLSGLLVTPTNWLVSALIVRSPGGYAELAILTAGIYFRTALLFFQNITGTVLLPIFSSHARAAREQVLWSSTAMNICVGLLGLGAASLAPDRLMRIFGKSFQGNTGVVVATVASGALMMAFAPVIYYLTGAGHQWTIMLSNGLWAALYFCGSVYGVRRGWGALGVARCCALAYALQCVFCVAAFARLRKAGA